jgi:hypothetical protein
MRHFSHPIWRLLQRINQIYSIQTRETPQIAPARPSHSHDQCCVAEQYGCSETTPQEHMLQDYRQQRANHRYSNNHWNVLRCLQHKHQPQPQPRIANTAQLALLLIQSQSMHWQANGALLSC